MRDDVSPPVMIGIIVAVVVVIGGIAYFLMTRTPQAPPIPAPAAGTMGQPQTPPGGPAGPTGGLSPTLPGGPPGAGGAPMMRPPAPR